MGILEEPKNPASGKAGIKAALCYALSHFQLSPSQQSLALYIPSFIFLASWQFLTIQSPNMHDLPCSATITNFLLGTFT